MITSTICWPLQICLYIRNIIVFQTSIHPAFLKKIRRSMKNYPSLASYIVRINPMFYCMAYLTLEEKK